MTTSVVRGRRALAIVAAGITLTGSILMTTTPSRADTSVSVPDVHFLNCLDENLGKAAGATVTAEDLAGLTQLYCDNKGISDLTGAQYLVNIEDLFLSGNAITSLGVLDGFEPNKEPVAINVSSNRIADLSPLKAFTGTAVYADGQMLEATAVVGKTTALGIKGRAGDVITHLTPAETWPSLTLAAGKVTAGKAGVYDINFSDPAHCSVAGECEYSFSGTVTVRAAAQFTATPAPKITGTAAVGSTLTASPVNWTPLQLDWTYQWYRNGLPIASANGPTHKVTADDAGWTLKVAVSGILDGYAGPSVSSAGVGIPGHSFGRTTRPEINGTATVGKTLTAEAEGWSPNPEAWTYQWKANGQPIPGATQASYLLVGTDAGRTITVTVTGMKPGYAPATTTSLATAKVALGTFQSAVPTIAGTLQVGHTLTAGVAGWSPMADHWSYRWYRNGKAIEHATKPTYTLVGSDARAEITVRVTGSKTGYITVGRTSGATTKIDRGRFTAPAPVIIGTAKVGHKLKVVTSGWSPTPSKMHRQWYRDGKKIAKATKTTYKVTRSDRGHSITVRVIGEKKGYVTLTKYALARRISK